MEERVVTYALKFSRNGNILDAEIHRTLEDASAAAYNYVAAFGHNLACSQFEQLLVSWDPEEDGLLVWGDDEYEIVIEPYLAKHPAREDNNCRVIPFRRSVA